MRVSEYIFRKIQAYKDEIAQIDAETHKTLKFDEIEPKSAALSKWMRERNLGRGNIVGLMSQNNVDFVWILLGIIDTGAACLLLDPKYTSREVIHAINTASVDALVLQRGIFTSICCPEIIEIQYILEFGDNENIPFSDGAIHVNSILANYCKGNTDFRIAKNEATDINLEYTTLKQHNCQNFPDNLALILSSSGSTGPPKGVIITHDNILAALELSGQFIEKGERAIGLMPFHHAYGLITMLLCLIEGASIVNISQFSLPFWIETIKQFSVSHMHVVPSLLVALQKSDAIQFDDLRSVRHIWAAAAPVSENEHEKLKKRFVQPVTVHKLYGLTETTYVMFAGLFDPEKPGSLGKLVASMQCKIIDKKNKKALPPNAVGEVCFKGPMLTKGYINNPKATSDAIDEEGWFHTGDVGYFDEDGYFYFVDRIKDIIKYQGHQISPCELESVLISHQHIKEAAVIGVSHDVFGQVPRAFVVPQENSNITAQKIHDYIKDMVAPYKQLRGGIVFLPSLPKTGISKNQKSLLRAMIPDTVLYDQKTKHQGDHFLGGNITKTELTIS